MHVRGHPGIDKDVLKWFRPIRRDVRIYYKSGPTDREYEPDFTAGTASGKWICETKAANDMNNPEVLTKAKAARLWCKHAQQTTGESWGYLLIPHEQVQMSMTIQGFIADYQC